MSDLILQEERAATVQDVAELFIATLLTLAAQRGCSSPTLAPWRFFPALAAVCVREVPGLGSTLIYSCSSCLSVPFLFVSYIYIYS